MEAFTRNRIYALQPDELAQLTSFRWHVGDYDLAKGREWRLASQADIPARGEEWFLVQSSQETKTSNDPPGPAVFREFADVRPTRDDVLKFANKHGWLGVGEPMIPSGVVPTTYTIPKETLKILRQNRHRKLAATKQLYPVRLGERLRTWFKEISTMHRLVRIWEPPFGVEAAKRKFEHRIRWISDYEVRYEWQDEGDEGTEVIASTRERPWLLPLVQARDYKKIFRWYLQIAVNERLKEHGVSARMLRHSERLELSIVPENLIGFLWLQFAKAVDGGKAYRRCEDCGKWFELGGKSSRKDKRFCSGTCKARSHRSKNQAESLKSRGTD